MHRHGRVPGEERRRGEGEGTVMRLRVHWFLELLGGGLCRTKSVVRGSRPQPFGCRSRLSNSGNGRGLPASSHALVGCPPPPHAVVGPHPPPHRPCPQLLSQRGAFTQWAQGTPVGGWVLPTPVVAEGWGHSQQPPAKVGGRIRQPPTEGRIGQPGAEAWVQPLASGWCDIRQCLRCSGVRARSVVRCIFSSLQCRALCTGFSVC